LVYSYSFWYRQEYDGSKVQRWEDKLIFGEVEISACRRGKSGSVTASLMKFDIAFMCCSKGMQ